MRQITIPSVSSPGHPSFSPDGRWIVFEASAVQGAPTDIFMMDINGRNLKNLTDTPMDWERNPSWPPDGRRIAFISEMAIHILDLETGQRKRISPPNSCDFYPSWSPDGKKILFESILSGNAEIFICDADGRNRRRLTNHPSSDQQPVFTPDGKKVVFVSRREDTPSLFVLNLTGREVKRLPVGGKVVATWRPAVLPDGGVITFKGKEAWSPDGKKISFTTRILPLKGEIWFLDLESGETRKITDGVGACWSPDGRRIAFTRYKNQNDPDIFICDVDGEDAIDLTNRTTKERSPIFTPDGDRLLFLSNMFDHTRWDIAVMDLETRHIRRILVDPRISIVCWDRLAVSPDGRRIFFSGREGDAPWDLYSIDFGGKGLVNLTKTPFVNEFYPHCSPFLGEMEVGPLDNR
ncbi:PD40 domain-containing protein [Candidatus Poribacteria bacterium]|nr:PD40 domain-containing protein [Candidatus Poribacteria bacterium]